MGTRDSRVDAYIARSADFAKPILNHIRELMHRGCPQAQETMKWSFPHFQYKGMLCSMASFKQHCSFSFWKAKLLEKQTAADVRTGKRKDGMGNFGRLTSLADLPSDAAMLALVRRAVELNDQGLSKPRPKPGKKKPLRMPAEFAGALKKHAKARPNFKAFTPSHKREYLEWIIEARTPETRARRIAEAIAWISKGKNRYWKYERC